MLTTVTGISEYTFAYRMSSDTTFYFQISAKHYCQALEVFLASKPYQTSFTVERGAKGYFKAR